MRFSPRRPVLAKHKPIVTVLTSSGFRWRAVNQKVICVPPLTGMLNSTSTMSSDFTVNPGPGGLVRLTYGGLLSACV
ncbi:MAG: hypothetical protein CM1200mP29_15720 [Verrucomicrobiota bacterium]|nr:MAG: hypothetical protein CM1200mP29_15720 [Verrucomicrobiota bacterium]